MSLSPDTVTWYRFEWNTTHLRRIKSNNAYIDRYRILINLHRREILLIISINLLAYRSGNAARFPAYAHVHLSAALLLPPISSASRQMCVYICIRNVATRKLYDGENTRRENDRNNDFFIQLTERTALSQIQEPQSPESSTERRYIYSLCRFGRLNAEINGDFISLTDVCFYLHLYKHRELTTIQAV